MKKIYLFFLATLFCGAIFAQQRKLEHYTVKALQADGAAPSLLKTLCVDTLDQYVQRANNQFVLQGAAGGGYVFGNSDDTYGGSYTTSTAVHFDDLGPITVDAVYMWVGFKQIVGSPDLVKMEIYTTGVDSMPNTLVGFTNASMAFVDTATGGVNFTTMARLARFQVGVGSNQLTGDFAVALNYDAIDDTIALVSTASGAGFLEGRTKQYLGANLGGGWVRAIDLWTGLDADVVIIPITTCVVSSDNPAFENDHFRVVPAYPNPSTDEINLDISLPHATQLQVILWDMSGRVLFDSGLKDKTAGDFSYRIDVSDIPAGTYHYTVRTSETSVNSKVQVVH